MATPRAAAAALKRATPRFIIGNAVLVLVVALSAWYLAKPAHAQTDPSFYYTFNNPGTLNEALSIAQSTSPYFWLRDGGILAIAGGAGTQRDAGRFLLLERALVRDSTTDALLNRTAEVFSSAADAQPYDGEAVYARYGDDNNFYYAGLRADGTVILKKKQEGAYATLAQAPLFGGTYSASHPDLIPHNTWIGLRLSVTTLASGAAKLVFFVDVGNTGSWKEVLSATDTTPLAAGLSGIESDHADMEISSFKFADSGLPASITQLVSNPVSAVTQITP